MTSLRLETFVDETEAWATLRQRAPKLRKLRAELKYHPFAGIVFDMPTLLGAVQRVHTLVDYYTGKAFLTGEWKGHAETVPEHQRVTDPQWATVSLDQARHRASQTVATANLRRTRLAGRGGLRERHVVPTVWKPNWMFHTELEGRNLEIMVDGLNGSYFVIGS